MQNKELALEKIVERCKRNYVNILPNNLNRQTQNPFKSQQTPIYKEFEKKDIHQMLNQFNTLIQLLTQNYIMASDKQVKARSYRVLKELRNLMQKDLDQFEDTILKRTNKQLLRYRLDYAEMVEDKRSEIKIDICPQVSLYQDPLLSYCFHPIVHDQLFKTQPLEDRKTALNVIQKHVPLFDKLWAPLDVHQEKSKSKFTILDDRILFIAILKYGHKNSKIIKSLYFPHREQQQIRNRIKNLCAKPSSNAIRMWRVSQLCPLDDYEMKRLVKVFEDLGPRWKVISRYYDIRTASYLQDQYNQSSKLARRKIREGMPQAGTFMERFKQFQNQLRMSMQPQQIYLLDGNIHHNDAYYDDTQIVSMQQESSVQSTELAGNYKVIDEMTFQFESIT